MRRLTRVQVRPCKTSNGSLGPAGSGAETYVGFLRADAERVVDALG